MIPNRHGSARIEAIDDSLLNTRLAEGQVAVIAGFQGIAPDNLRLTASPPSPRTKAR